MANEDALGKEIRKMKSTTDSLDRFMKEQTEKNKKSALISLILTLAIVVVYLGFIFTTISTLKSNLAPEKFEASLKKHAPDVLPVVSEKFAEVVTDIYPVYYELAVQRTVQALPEWTTIIEDEMSKFTEQTEQQANLQLKKALEGAIKHSDKPLRQAFPKLSDQDVKQLMDDLQNDLSSDMVDVVKYIEDHSFKDILELKKTLDGFDTGGLPDDEGQLSKLFIHYTLLMVDLEVMEGGSKIERGKKWKNK